jgi:hypothetical protein
MEYAASILASANKYLQKVFETDEVFNFKTQEDLHLRVEKMVLYLLRKDRSRLLHILYRVDVEEQQVKKALLAPSEEEVAAHLSRLIIRRELQKAQTRLIYSRQVDKFS